MLLQCINKRYTMADSDNVLAIPYVYMVQQSDKYYEYFVYRGDVYIGEVRLDAGGFYAIKSKRCSKWSKPIYSTIKSSIDGINRKIGG